MSKRLVILLAVGILIAIPALVLKRGTAGAEFLWSVSNGGAWLLPLIVVSAILDSINPCAFSILLVTIAVLWGLGRIRSDIIRIGAVYILGIFLAYLLIGLGLLQALHLFNTPHFMAKLGAGLLLVLGLASIAGQFLPSFPIRLRIPAAVHRPMSALLKHGSAPAVFLLGGLVGLCEFPCTGGPYLMAVGLLHDRTTYVAGIGYLLLYNLIFILPLAIMLAMASDRLVLERMRRWQRQSRTAMRTGGGLAMVALGALIFLL